MNRKNTYQAIIFLAAIGGLFFLMIRNAESIVLSLFSILVSAADLPVAVYHLMPVFTKLIMIIFWVFLLFGYLKNFSGLEGVTEVFSRKFILKAGILAVCLFVVSRGANYLVRMFSSDYLFRHFTMYDKQSVNINIYGGF